METGVAGPGHPLAGGFRAASTDFRVPRSPTRLCRLLTAWPGGIRAVPDAAPVNQGNSPHALSWGPGGARGTAPANRRVRGLSRSSFPSPLPRGPRRPARPISPPLKGTALPPRHRGRLQVLAWAWAWACRTLRSCLLARSSSHIPDKLTCLQRSLFHSFPAASAPLQFSLLINTYCEHFVLFEASRGLDFDF